MRPVPVIDLFAGPGGLNEGFTSLKQGGAAIFQTVASFEMESSAYSTLTLRTAMRHVLAETGSLPTDYYSMIRGDLSFDEFASRPDIGPALKAARQEVHRLVLGPQTREESGDLIKQALSRSRTSDDPWVLIGGPPCQAYSLVGRSRRRADPTFAEDEKHVLYREYLHIIREFRPTVFVMENVKGMLSSKHDGGGIFQQILGDLRDPAPDLGYDVYSFTVPGDDPAPQEFIIRSEFYGIPQKRHRVILLGVLRGSDLGAPPQLGVAPRPVTVDDAIGDLPKIRSRVNPRSADTESMWRASRMQALQHAYGKVPDGKVPGLGQPYLATYRAETPDSALTKWLIDQHVGGITLHESRGHMPTDLVRYGYLAAMAAKENRSRKLNELPPALLPQHKNASRADAPFNDRFRVQLRDQPSTTVVSHIAKDGHYYIHYDPMQMRSLSVREAARLQTFPDNYFFMGNRTSQYQQVGNAVPPLLARQLSSVVARLLGLAD